MFVRNAIAGVFGSTLMAFAAGAASGAVGGAFVLRHSLTSPFDWGEFFGLVFAALIAALAAEVVLRGYFRPRERDEVSRRWVDEGFTIVGNLTTSDFGRERTNHIVCRQVLDAARHPNSEPRSPYCIVAHRFRYSFPV